MNESTQKKQAPQRSLRIVVADDDKDTVVSLKLLLEDEGHTVRGVYFATEVLRHVRAMRPDAVILDIGMPGQSGYSLAQDIRNAYYGMRKPLLIAITGLYKRPTDRMLARLSGFDHHLVKPYETQALLELLTPLTAPSPKDAA